MPISIKDLGVFRNPPHTSVENWPGLLSFEMICFTTFMHLYWINQVILKVSQALWTRHWQYATLQKTYIASLSINFVFNVWRNDENLRYFHYKSQIRHKTVEISLLQLNVASNIKCCVTYVISIELRTKEMCTGCKT